MKKTIFWQINEETVKKKTDSASFPGTWKVDTSTLRHKNTSQLSFYYITERDTRALRQSQKGRLDLLNKHSVLCLNSRSSIKNSLEWTVLRTWVVSLSKTILKLSLAFSPYFNSGCVSTQTERLKFKSSCNVSFGISVDVLLYVVWFATNSSNLTLVYPGKSQIM